MNKITKILIISFIIFIPIILYAADAITVSIPSNLIGSGDPNMDLNIVIKNIIRGIIGVLGSITLLMVVYGGLLWIASAGNAEKIQIAKNILKWSSMGIIIIFLSYSIIIFVFNIVGIDSGGVEIETQGMACPCINEEGDNGPNCVQGPATPPDGYSSCAEFGELRGRRVECQICERFSSSFYFRGLCPGANNNVCTYIDSLPITES